MSRIDRNRPFQARSVRQLNRKVQEVVKVNRLDSFGDFLIHRVVLQNRMF